MQLKSIFLGIAITAILLAMLVATRMMVLTTPIEEFEIRDIDTVELAEPPPPAPEEEVMDDVPPPPPPALADLSVTLDVNQPAIPVSPMKVDPTLAVDTFFSDLPPSPLPRPVVKRPTAKHKGPVGPKTISRPKVKHVAPVKSQYSIGELDQKPGASLYRWCPRLIPH